MWRDISITNRKEGLGSTRILRLTKYICFSLHNIVGILLKKYTFVEVFFCCVFPLSCEGKEVREGTIILISRLMLQQVLWQIWNFGNFITNHVWWSAVSVNLEEDFRSDLLGQSSVLDKMHSCHFAENWFQPLPDLFLKIFCNF